MRKKLKTDTCFIGGVHAQFKCYAHMQLVEPAIGIFALWNARFAVVELEIKVS
jgi:hypothetical protein